MNVARIDFRTVFLSSVLFAAPCGAATYEGRYQVAGGDRYKVVVTVPDAPSSAIVPLDVRRESTPAHKTNVCDVEREIGWGDGPVLECAASHEVEAPEYDQCSQSFSFDFGQALVRVFALTAAGETPYSQAVVPLKFDVFAGFDSSTGPKAKEICPSPSSETALRIAQAGTVRKAVIKQNKGDRSNLVVDATFELRDLKARMLPAAAGRGRIAFDGGAVKIGDFYTYSSGRLDASAAEVSSYDHFDDSNKIEFRPVSVP
jgi:hypothetical protein